MHYHFTSTKQYLNAATGWSCCTGLNSSSFAQFINFVSLKSQKQIKFIEQKNILLKGKNGSKFLKSRENIKCTKGVRITACNIWGVVCKIWEYRTNST